METRVRAVLRDHLLSQHPQQGLHPADDPNALLDAGLLAADLETVRATSGDAAVRRLAQDYVTLWARTFRTLVRHLRGRPERALQLFCGEVYPFLRGDQRAARIEAQGRNEARVLLADDLPPAYLGGLLESFVALSGAQTSSRTLGHERFQITFRLHPRDAGARTVQWFAGLRIPLLLTAALATALGTAFAIGRGVTAWWPAVLVLVGAVAAQSGANALHDLRQRDLGPLSLPRTGRAWRWIQAGGSYATAAIALAALVWLGHVGLLAFAAAGLVTSLAYAALRNHGLGPFVAAVAHGPLIVAGTVLVLSPEATAWSTTVLVGLGPGLLTAAMLYLDDIADRPLDEAGGKRTLAVRLPQARNLVVFATLAVGGVAASAFVAARETLADSVWWFLPSFGLAVALVRDVARHLDDPRGLARSRIVSLGLHALTTAMLAALILTEIP